MKQIPSHGVTRTDVVRWSGEFDAMWRLAGAGFPRRDTRRRGEQYVRGLLGRVERKNGWQVAEYVGERSPYALQHVLDRASWDADAIRDELRRYAADHVLAPGESGILAVDETGFLKKGDKSAGVQRQYSGTAGRIENCQIGVFLALSGSRGRSLVDRDLYVPKSWCDDRARCRAAKIPPGTRFATKPQLAQRMLARAFEGGLSPSWVVTDEVYGSDSKFRRFLEEWNRPYVLAVSSQQRLWIAFRQQRLDALGKEIPAGSWFRLSIGAGAKGPRVYDWAAARFGLPSAGGLIRWVLFRRSVERHEDRAYYFCLAPVHATAKELAMAAGQRWSIECCFEAAKQETGLDEYEVRSWHGWYRHVTLSMLALAFLSAVRAQADVGGKGKKRTCLWCR